MKKILKADATKERAIETISEIAGIVKETLGPGGRTIVIQRPGQNIDGTPLKPLITKDGVTVAENIRFKDSVKDTIAQAILQVAQSTVAQAGDGTTTAIVLAEAIYRAGYKLVKQGANSIELFNALKELKDQAIAIIEELKVEITEDDIFNVAKISANGDEDVAAIVAEAVMSVGEDGYISLEEGFSRETQLDKIQGAMYKQGWRGFGAHGSLLVNNKAKNSCEMTTPAILLFGGKLDSVDELGRFINKLMGANASGELTAVTPFLIVAHDYSDEVKNFIIQARVQQKLPVAAIRTPFDGSPNARTEILHDLAALLGATVGGRGILEPDNMNDTHMGCAERVEILPEEIVFINGQGDEKTILDRVADMKRLKDESRLHDFDRENLQLRIGKMVGGIAIVRVGGDTELEMLEKKDRIEDALCAARVAIADGIVEGGGYTLLVIAEALKGSSIASQIMSEALEEPIRQIIRNSGKNPDVILSHLSEGQGYDARKHVACNLMEAGIIDPAKVTKSALENAVSIAGLLLTSGGAIVLDTESKEGTPNPFAAMGLG